MKNTEIGMIPDDWEVKNIGTTCNVFTGGEVPLKYSKDKNEVFKYPIYSNGKDVYGYYTGFVIGDDSVCISSIGENTGDVFFYKGEFTPVIRLKVVVPKSNKISTKYLYYYLKAHKIDGTKNGGIPNINANDVKILNFPLPPTLAEQQKIAKALSDVDNVISTLEKLITKKKNLKEGTMQQLLTGKKRLPGFGPAVVEPVETTKFKQTEIGEIPEDWEVVQLNTLIDDISDGPFGSNLKTEHYTTEREARIIQLSNVGEDGWNDENTKYTTFTHAKELSRCIVPSGSVIIAKMMPAGRSILCPNNERMYILGSDCVKFIPNKLIDSKYFVYYTKCTAYLNQIKENTQGSTRARTSVTKLRKIEVVLPSKPEQIAIANVLSAMDKEIKALNTKLEKYRNLKTGMMQQLLTGKIRLV